MNDFYVYILFHPETGLPFYVGKGRNRRIRAHLSDLRCNSEKAEIVKRAIALGLDIPAVKVKEGLKEFEAFRLEEIYIAVIGRSPDGPLVNRSDGGQGAPTPAQKQGQGSPRLSGSHEPERPCRLRFARRSALRPEAESRRRRTSKPYVAQTRAGMFRRSLLSEGLHGSAERRILQGTLLPFGRL